MKKITVVGSISTDFVVSTKRRPEIGETVEGDNFSTSFGGKGANQAVVSSRLGIETHMVGAVGGDEFADSLISNLKQNNIFVEDVERVTHSPSGSAVITLSEKDNSIIYVPGANGEVTIDNIQRAQETLQKSDMVLVQNETPEEVVKELILQCNSWNVPLLLNPAPARKLDQKHIDFVSYLTPNETEFDVLFPNKTLGEVLEQYPNKLVVTLGEQGAAFHDGEKVVLVPAHPVEKVIDTTGAGDTFNGAFAVAVISGLSMLESIRFANFAASISIQKEGAQTGAPTLNELKGLKDYEEAWTIK